MALLSGRRFFQNRPQNKKVELHQDLQRDSLASWRGHPINCFFFLFLCLSVFLCMFSLFLFVSAAFLVIPFGSPDVHLFGFMCFFTCLAMSLVFTDVLLGLLEGLGYELIWNLPLISVTTSPPPPTNLSCFFFLRASAFNFLFFCVCWCRFFLRIVFDFEEGQSLTDFIGTSLHPEILSPSSPNTLF